MTRRPDKFEAALAVLKDVQKRMGLVEDRVRRMERELGLGKAPVGFDLGSVSGGVVPQDDREDL